MLKGLEEKKRRYEELQKLISDPKVISSKVEYQKYTKEMAGLTSVVHKYNDYLRVDNELKDMEKVLTEKGHDQDFLHLAVEEKAKLEEKKKALEIELEELLLEGSLGGDKNVIMEIRAGTGGLEASLFAADLLRMYSKYASKKGWKSEPIDANITEKSGYKEVIFSISGKDVYGTLRYESGTHRVQRVPITEASGRIHTSAATVAVLPEAGDVEVDIKPQDLKIDVFRASGRGGQHVNVTDSAVRITHLATGLVVTCQDERSQHKNKAKALRVLRARLLAKIEQEQAKKISADRKAQVGSGDRSEKIRTYNFPDRRVTDHRIGLTIHNLEGVMEGDLDEIIQALKDADRKARLEAMK